MSSDQVQHERSNNTEILEQKKKDIIEQLNNPDVCTIILVGDSGMGKTWIVREISEHDSYYETLWVYMTEKYDINLFYKDIAQQYLSLSSITEEWAQKEENEQNKTLDLKEVKIIRWGHREEKLDQGEEATDKLKERIQEKMKDIGQALSTQNKYHLLVLDNEGDNLLVDGGDNLIDGKLHIILSQQWKSMFPSKFSNCLKIIITTRSLGGSNAVQTREAIRLPPHLQQGEPSTLSQNSVDKKIAVIRLRPLEQGERSTLLQKSVDTRVSSNDSFSQLDRAVAEKSDGKPAAIIVIAKALNYIAHDNSKLGSAIIKAVQDMRNSEGANPLFYCAFNMIEDSVTKNCFWHSIQLFCNYGGVSYNELITHWIMEGYFDPFERVEEAYWKGYDVLKELIDRALLKIQENNIVAVEREALKIINSCQSGFNDHTAALGLFSVFKKEESLGRVTRMNGMIKTLCNPKCWKKNSTLLIDDSHLSEEVHQTFFNVMKELRVLAVFRGRSESLISSLSEMDKLLVLVLRSCDLQDDIAHIMKLKALKVLEISGDESNSISIRDDLLDEMTHLVSLNLSGLSMKSLPSLSKLKHLKQMLLRDCRNLRSLPKLQHLTSLQILDLKGAVEFSTFTDESIADLDQLRILDLSETSIRKLPRMHQNLSSKKGANILCFIAN